MIKAIIFDLDGTLADTISAIQAGLNLTMRSFGYPEHSYDEVLSYVNNGARELCRRAMPKELQSNEALVDAVKADYDKKYQETYHLTDKTYDGIVEALTSLSPTKAHSEGETPSSFATRSGTVLSGFAG